MVYAIERSIDPILGMKVVFAGKSVEVVERFKSQIYGTDYIQFQMRVDNAGINAIGQSWCTLDEFSNKLTKDEPRYHLYRYIHTTENGIRNSIGKNLVFYILKVTTSFFEGAHLIRFMIDTICFSCSLYSDNPIPWCRIEIRSNVCSLQKCCHERTSKPRRGNRFEGTLPL